MLLQSFSVGLVLLYRSVIAAEICCLPNFYFSTGSPHMGTYRAAALHHNLHVPPVLPPLRSICCQILIGREAV